VLAEFAVFDEGDAVAIPDHLSWSGAGTGFSRAHSRSPSSDELPATISYARIVDTPRTDVPLKRNEKGCDRL
jgi:hypothetical protein